MNYSLLEAGLRQLGIPNEGGLVQEKLKRYIKELELWNKKINLVKASGEELIREHILDSLSAYPFIKKRQPDRVLDVGSGAGLPGIPLAIAMPEVQFHLAERSAKRVTFLQNAVLAIALGNVHVEHSDVAQIKDTYSMIVMRAFKELDTILSFCLPILKPEGIIAAYKGKKKRVEEELSHIDYIREKYPLNISIQEIEVPFMKKDRCLVCIKFAGIS